MAAAIAAVWANRGRPSPVGRPLVPPPPSDRVSCARSHDAENAINPWYYSRYDDARDTIVRDRFLRVCDKIFYVTEKALIPVINDDREDDGSRIVSVRLSRIYSRTAVTDERHRRV